MIESMIFRLPEYRKNLLNMDEHVSVCRNFLQYFN